MFTTTKRAPVRAKNRKKNTVYSKSVVWLTLANTETRRKKKRKKEKKGGKEEWKEK